MHDTSTRPPRRSLLSSNVHGIPRSGRRNRRRRSTSRTDRPLAKHSTGAPARAAPLRKIKTGRTTRSYEPEGPPMYRRAWAVWAVGAEPIEPRSPALLPPRTRRGGGPAASSSCPRFPPSPTPPSPSGAADPARPIKQAKAKRKHRRLGGSRSRRHGLGKSHRIHGDGASSVIKSLTQRQL